jgi:hypothetical protein
MSTRETSPEIASMAGRILAAGNPLDNDQVILAVIEGLADANTGKQAQAALKTMFQPYFDNMLSLAGSCLAQAEPDDDENGLPRIAITATVDWSKITNAIIGAFEGGSTYWLRECEYTYRPEGVEGNPLYAEDQFWAKGGKMNLSYDDPDDQEQRATKEVGLIEIKQGLRTMAEKDPRHFGDLVSENDDAATHDVFIQHVIFGEVIYG